MGATCLLKTGLAAIWICAAKYFRYANKLVDSDTQIPEWSDVIKLKPGDKARR